MLSSMEKVYIKLLDFEIKVKKHMKNEKYIIHNMF